MKKDPVKFRKEYERKRLGQGRTTRNWVVWKKVLSDEHAYAIVKLSIPKGVRVNIGKMKCRAEKAKILRVEDPFGGKIQSGFSWYESTFEGDRFTYRAGKVRRPTYPFDSSSEECESGIHFFRTRREARNYIF